MKRRIERKLNLSKETLRNLSEHDLKGVVGGTHRTVATDCTDYTCITECYNCTESCWSVRTYHC